MMTGSADDDFRELSALLFGAKDRYRSARATISHTVNGAVAKEANRRFVDWRFDQGSPGMGIIGKPGPPEREDFYQGYEGGGTADGAVRLWHERPGRWREERGAPGGGLLSCTVSAGPAGPWWVYRRGETALEVPVPVGERPEMDFSFMLDPSEESFRMTLTHDTTVHKTGRRAVVAGREALEVRVGTVSWGYPPILLPDFCAFVEGTTDHLLLVDTEIGAVLRVAARLEGREFRVAEVAEVAYDEQFPEGTFRLELPGVEFEPRER